MPKQEDIEVGTVWQHVSRGTKYTVLGTGRLQVDDPELDNCIVVIYSRLREEINDPHEVWVRPVAEFIDGRFEKVSP